MIFSALCSIDPYDFLGVPVNCTDKDLITRAYAQKQQTYLQHKQRSQHEEDLTGELSLAFLTLCYRFLLLKCSETNNPMVAGTERETATPRLQGYTDNTLETTDVITDGKRMVLAMPKASNFKNMYSSSLCPRTTGDSDTHGNSVTDNDLEQYKIRRQQTNVAPARSIIDWDAQHNNMLKRSTEQARVHLDRTGTIYGTRYGAFM